MATNETPATVPMNPPEAEEKPRRRVRKRRKKPEAETAASGDPQRPEVESEAEAETAASEPGPTGQTYIAGCEPPRIPEVDRAAIKYRETRDQRMELTRQEAELKAALLDAMKEHGLEQYPVPDTDVEVVVQHGEDNVKVRKRQGAAEE